MTSHPFDQLLDDDDFMDAVAPAADRDATPRPLADLQLPRRWATIGVLALLGLLAVAIASQARGHGYKTRALHWLFPTDPRWVRHPAVTAMLPHLGEGTVRPDAVVSVDVRLPNRGAVVDAATVTPDAVRLYRTGDAQPVDARVNTTAAGDAVVLTPAQPLDLNTTYTFEVRPALKDTAGAAFAPFHGSFTTAAASKAETYPVAFEKIALPQTVGHRYTCVTVGPDHRLYASTIDGYVVRFPIAPDGTVSDGETVVSPATTSNEARLITGLTFDPTAPSGEPILWITHGQLTADHETPADWTGKISRLSGPGLSHYEDVVVGLPRSTRDHLTNQAAFGPDGALYVAQASNTAMGAPDPGWGMRPERLLSAAILRVDTKAIRTPPLNVRTDADGGYDPFATGAPVTLYATGLRNAFDLLWHRNGTLYAPVNGSSAGGNAPGYTPTEGQPRPKRIDGSTDIVPAPALTDVRMTEQDVMARVTRHGYYGHPNPTRGEYVLNGGNPTAARPTSASSARLSSPKSVEPSSPKSARDPFEVPAYPVGTQPDPNWRRPAFDFGKHLAPCGLIEYRGPASGSALDGKILVTRYSGGKDIAVLTPDPATGQIAEALTGLDGLTGFADPLDLCEDLATGCLYVAEHVGGRITLVRPKPGSVSQQVYRQAAGATGMPPSRAEMPVGSVAD